MTMTDICRYIRALSGLLAGLVLSASAGAVADVSTETWVLQPRAL